MIINKILFLLLESVKSIYRSLVPSIVSSLTISISLVLLSISCFIYINMQDYTSELKDEYRIEVFFDNDIELSKALDVFNKILLIDGIEEGLFIDKSSAAKIFKKEFNEDVEEIIGTNPLPMGGTYGIAEEYRKHSQIEGIVSEINSMPDIDEALFPQDAIIKFDRISRNILAFSFFLGFSVMLIALFFVLYTILLVVYSNRNEINTMRLLGATQLFIKFPYIIEGMILGCVGALISMCVLYSLYNLSAYIIEPYYLMPSFLAINIFLFNLILGLLLGLIGSSRALSSNSINN